ncbi:hypothetical protein [Saccharothrix longispora]|uniref:hypothetical protein n=1 Tax=Saccharothrix longispora TaxID=33920 RepID=UPI0028FD40C3|nr:hypothetical protein [Saccharothrix longispora]MDU0292773.1 hypothetical protein [Saccharothrix longispora]
MRTWLDGVLGGRHFAEHGYDSAHLDELPGVGYDAATAVARGLELLDQVVLACGDRAAEVMVAYVVVLAGTGEFERAAPAFGDLAAAWDALTPPELYVLPRWSGPYPVEEYRRSYPAGVAVAPVGVYHAYYRCHRQGDALGFTRAVHVEHHPG